MKSRFFIPLLTLLTILCTGNALAQQNAIIKGKITIIDNTTADNVSVFLKGTQIGTTTDDYGNYEIKNIKPGSYVLRVSAVGHSAKEKNISLKSGDEIVENFTISNSSEQLNEVTIESAKTNAFARKESAQVSKMSLNNLENPQVYNTISAELLKEQVNTNIDDALKNAPGLTQLWASTGRGGDGAGYFSLRGFAVQPTMINGLPGLTNGSLDPQNIERIEVIKGPSGTLFGSSLISYGGLINVTTKKPYETFGGDISYTSGSYGLNRVTADINTPLNKEKGINFRINAAYHTEDSFQDAGFKRSFFVAPSLSYRVSDKLSFVVNTEIMSAEQTNPTMLFFDRNAPLRVTDIDAFGYNNKRSYTSNQLTLATPSFNLQGQMFYKLSDKWTSQTVLSRSASRTEGYYSYLYESTQYYPAITQGVVLGRYFNYQNSSTLTTDIQQNFNGDFNIGKFRNRIVAGLDYFNRNTTDNGTGYVGNGAIYIGNADLQTVNENVFFITNPADYVLDGDSGNLTKSGSDALLVSAPISNANTKQAVFSAYVSDVINFTPALSVMLSLRADRFMNYGDVTDNIEEGQTTFSPKFGLVYQPILDKVSLFANYMDGFSNTAVTTDVNLDGSRTPRSFGPDHAKQFEIGTKLNLMKDKLYASLSYYNIEVKDQVYTLYGPTTQLSFDDGAQKNRGFETEIVANPIKGLNIIAGYSFNDSKLIAGDTDFIGHRPESAGSKHLANLWASYKFAAGTLNGFGLGFGGNYASDNYIMNRTIAGKFTIPSYTVLNASIFYGSDDYKITLKVDNIANRETYDGWSTVHPRTPRSVLANFTYKF
ncbi:MAG: TonB-dependent receptor [Flavobacterium sp.]|nr:TonB-dependent receptor [Flavobacterium sp.]